MSNFTDGTTPGLGGSADAPAGAESAAGSVGSSSTDPSAAKAGAADGLPNLAEVVPSFRKLFPDTRYFEIDSVIAGARFSAWVTCPPFYDADQAKRYPIVYQVDGNLFFPATAPFHHTGSRDPMSPLQPFILVSVGYSEEESHAWTWLRVRDLLPPGETVPEVMFQALDMTIEAGLLPAEEGAKYHAMFAKPAADKFLEFLEDELHPALTAIYRVDESEAGLWGDSYGGLFAAYVAIKQSRLFKRVGAGSPGIIGRDSQIFKLYDQAVAEKRDYSDRRLHVTIGTREITQTSLYQQIVAQGTAELLARTSENPLTGLQVSAEVLQLETHITASIPAWFSFLRACYSQPAS